MQGAKGRAFGGFGADIDRNGQQQRRGDERNARQPQSAKAASPMLRRDTSTTASAATSPRGRRLNPRRIGTAPVGRGVFDHIDDRAAIFTAHGDPLKGCVNPPASAARQCPRLTVGGQKADQNSGGTHQKDGVKKGALTPFAVADMTEQKRPERPRQESPAQRSEAPVSLPVVSSSPEKKVLVMIEVRAPKMKKIIPFKGRACRRGSNDGQIERGSAFLRPAERLSRHS